MNDHNRWQYCRISLCCSLPLILLVLAGTINTATAIEAEGMVTTRSQDDFLTQEAPTFDPSAVPIMQSAFLIVRNNSLSPTQYYAVRGADGAIVFTAATAEITVNAAIAALPTSGGTVAFRPGVFELATPIVINRNSVTLRGANAGGDLFFTSMDNGTQGFDNKVATVLLAAGDHDAISIGMGDALIFGAAVVNLGISGEASNEPIPRPTQSGGAGIHVRECDTIQIRQVDIRRKAYGIFFDKAPDQPMPWNVADVLTIDTLYLSYCGWGLWVDGWLGNAKISNVFGYLNSQGLLMKTGSIGQYDWQIDSVTSQADGWNGTTAPVVLKGCQDLTLSRLSLNGLADFIQPPGRPTPIIHITANVCDWNGVEGYRAHFRLSQLVLFGTLQDAILVDGTGGMVDIDTVHIGSTGSQDFYGNLMPNISGAVVRVVQQPHNKKYVGTSSIGARGSNSDIFHLKSGSSRSSSDVAPMLHLDVWVRSGFAVSQLPDRASNWFIGVTSVQDIRGFNPLGVIPKPFGNNSVPTLGLGGVKMTPVSGVQYQVMGTAVTMFVDLMETMVLNITDNTGVPFMTNARGAPYGVQLPLGSRVVMTYPAGERPLIRIVGP